MCGIAGLMLRKPGSIGKKLVRMLDGLQHRGPDSTGFALYREPKPDRLVMRILLKCSSETHEGRARVTRVQQVLAGFGVTVLATALENEHLRLEVADVRAVKELSYAIENQAGVEILSIGTALEIIKDVGSALQIDRSYNISAVKGTHCIGHVRLATESIVDASRAHPFWAYGFSDVAIVHNGQITNYWKMKRRLQKAGYQFRTDNDSELVAVYLADKLGGGLGLEEVLARSVDELDGTFSFLVSTPDGLGFAKDHLAAKPMVVLEKDDIVAVASEEVALNRLFPGESLDTFEPFPGAYKTWQLSTLALSA